MPAEDVELIRDTLGTTPFVERDSAEGEEWLDFGEDPSEEEPVDEEQLAAELRAEQEAEIVRLLEEIVVSERRQQALEPTSRRSARSAEPRRAAGGSNALPRRGPTPRHPD